MSDSTVEKLSVDSVSVSQYAWNVTQRGSRWKVPSVRGDNVTVPGRHGSIYVPDKKYDENELILNMWVIGAELDGSVPVSDTQRKQVRENMDTLLHLFTRRYEEVRLSQVLADGSTVEAYGECTEAIDFTSVAGGTRAEFSVAMRLSDPFWQDTSDVTYNSGAAVVVDQQFALTNFDGATAPMDELAFVVSGPATNPELVLLDTGAVIRYNGTIASGTDWRVNSDIWESVTGSAIGFVGAGTNVLANTVYSGSTRMFSVHPWRQTGHAVIEINGSGFGANTRLQVKGRRKYMVA